LQESPGWKPDALRSAGVAPKNSLLWPQFCGGAPPGPGKPAPSPSHVIDQWRNLEAIKIAQSDDERMTRIREITDQMRYLQEQKNEALRMKLRGEVDAKTFREVTAEIDAAHDQLAREHNRLASEAAMPELPDPSLAWEDLSLEDRRTLTEMLIDKIVIAPHPHKIVDGRRHYTVRAIPYQDPEMEAERLKKVHEARVKIVPRV
jgi:hypothetical protein